MSHSIDWFQLFVGLVGGLALFLLGLDQLTGGLKKLAGEGLRRALARLTGNRFSAALTGAVVTAAVNSSSVTTVLVVGFVTAGVMSVAQSVGVIMGANIGSTVTAQLIAFDIGAYSLLAVALGFTAHTIGKREYLRYGGLMLLGLGLVFFGMDLMSESMRPLRSYQPFLDLMQRMDIPLLGAAIGALFTALVQSSAATTGIAIAMAGQGVLSLQAGIALALGANVGTCATALLAAIGKPRPAVRAAAVHVLFNIAGVLIWLPLIDQLEAIARALSPASQLVDLAARRAAETPRQIANAHTLFNIVNTVLFIGFTGPIARGVLRLLPDRPRRQAAEPRYLDNSVVHFPAMAIPVVRLEIGHLGERVLAMLADARRALLDSDASILRDMEEREAAIDDLQRAILAYCGIIRASELDHDEELRFRHLVESTNALEAAGDVVTEELVELARRRHSENVPISASMLALIDALTDQVATALGEAITAISQADHQAAQRVLDHKDSIRDHIDQATAHLADTLVEQNDERVAIVRFETAVVDALKHCYSAAKRIAKATLAEPPEDGSLLGHRQRSP